MPERGRITVLIPAKNEAANIGDVILGARRHADDVLVADGGSRDGTGARALEAGARVIEDEGRDEEGRLVYRMKRTLVVRGGKENA